jgi:hypothetical protein
MDLRRFFEFLNESNFIEPKEIINKQISSRLTTETFKDVIEK